MVGRTRRQLKGLARRATIGAALVAYLFAAAGIPLPLKVYKEVGVRFPCEHHECGCATAGECWDHCCCYSPSEKLAWARANHVEPPQQLVSEVTRLALAGVYAHDDHVADYADHDHDTAHCDEPSSCCTDKHAKTAGCSSCVKSTSHDETDSKTVIPSLARFCKGLPTEWFALGAVLPADVSRAWQLDWGLVESVIFSSSGRELIASAPAVPPPRV